MVKGFRLDVRFPIALLLAVSGGTALAAEPPQSTTLAPVHVHASDTAVLNTPSVTVHIPRERLQQQNLVDSADALRYAPNLQVR